MQVINCIGEMWLNDINPICFRCEQIWREQWGSQFWKCTWGAPTPEDEAQANKSNNGTNNTGSNTGSNNNGSTTTNAKKSGATDHNPCFKSLVTCLFLYLQLFVSFIN